MKKTQYEKFLECLGGVELLLSDIALDLQVAKRNLYRSIRQAEAAGLVFIKQEINGGLYSIQLTPESWQKLKSHHVRICMASGREKWGFDAGFVCQG